MAAILNRRQRKRISRLFRHPVETAGVRLAFGAVDHLSTATVEKFTESFAGIWYRIDYRRRRIASENILAAGLAADRRSAAAIAQTSFRHFGRMTGEMLAMKRILQDEGWDKLIDDSGVDATTRAILEDKSQGILIVSGHIGNWELAAQWIAQYKPLVVIARNMNNPQVQRMIEEHSPRRDVRVISKHEADTATLLRCLKDGCALSLLIDQNARSHGVPIEFLGRNASTYPSAALLHLVTRTPLCFGACIRTGPRRFKIEADAPLAITPSGNRQADVKTILETLTRQLENTVRKHPEQYLWGHRRWRSNLG